MRTPSFYVYELRYPDTGKPFYVGKGTDDGSRAFRRAHMHARKHGLVRNVIKAIRKRGAEPSVCVVFETPSEAEAITHEGSLINKYGRRFDGGLLWNSALGGVGGHRRSGPMTAEHKAKISAALVGRKRTQEQRDRMAAAQRRRVRTDEEIVRLVNGLYGRKLSEESRRKIAESNAKAWRTTRRNAPCALA